MSTDTALTMEELELEQAELLPSRETLGCYRPPCCYHPCGSSLEVIVVVKHLPVVGSQSVATAAGNSAG